MGVISHNAVSRERSFAAAESGPSYEWRVMGLEHRNTQFLRSRAIHRVIPCRLQRHRRRRATRRNRLRNPERARNGPSTEAVVELWTSPRPSAQGAIPASLLREGWRRVLHPGGSRAVRSIAGTSIPVVGSTSSCGTNAACVNVNDSSEKLVRRRGVEPKSAAQGQRRQPTARRITV